jgi:RHS repeat-associated protein
MWDAGSTNREWYVYDSGGSRVLRRSTNSSSTTLTVYAFGLEEHSYSSSGSNTGNTYYYGLVGRLIGELTGSTTNFFLTDSLGSVLSRFSQVAGSAAVQGNQVYGPYGKQRYKQGTMGTSKGFTGQYNDSLTGLDYYHARYYDPKVGAFLSADPVEGNGAGRDPYAYVGGNPETWSDPTGLVVTPGDSVFSEAPSQAPVGGGGIGQAIVQGIVVILTAIGAAEEEINNAQYAVSPPPASSHPASGPAVTLAETSDAVNSVILAAHRANSDEGDDLAVVNSVIWAAHRPHPGLQPQPQPSGGGQQPPNKPPVSITPPEPPSDSGGGPYKKLPVDLFRQGNASSPRVDNVRIGKDVNLDENNNICAGGISSFEYRTQPGKWWNLPKDTELPEGLQVRKDDPNDPYHWSFEPSRPMTVDEYIQLLQSISAWEPAFTKVAEHAVPC